MNKKYTYIWISLVILVFGIIFIPRIVDRLNSGDIVENDRMSIAPESDKLAYIMYDDAKRKVPSFKFYDQDSVLVTDKDYLGKVYVVEFFFTRCPSICPIMTQNLVTLQEEFKGRDDFGIASFSITPQYDSPSVLTKYAEKYGIDDPNWHLLTGDKDEIYELSNQGFNIYAAENDEVLGGFEHSGLFALIDKEGYMRSRKDNFGNPLVYYRGAITEAQGENDQGETEEMSILKRDIKNLLSE